MSSVYVIGLFEILTDDQTTADSDSTLFNDLYTLDSDNMNWTHIDIENAPSARYGHSG